MYQNSDHIDKQLEYFLLNTFLRKSSDIIMVTDGGADFSDARVLGVNSSFEFVTGFSQKILNNSFCTELLNTSVVQLRSLHSAFKTGSAVQHQIAVKNIRSDFTQIQFEIYPVQQNTEFWIWQAKSTKPTQLINHDPQLNQQNMMRTIEKIAGQTAHDFNNILAIIMGNNDLLLENIEGCSPFYTLLQSISRAVDKGTQLTQTLQMFAQKKVLSNNIFNLNECLSSMAEGLQENIGSYPILKIELFGQPCNICVDQTMLQKSIHHLVLNAAQSMSEKSIEKSIIVIQIKKSFVPQQKDVFEQLILSQEYIKLIITDTGTGITAANLPLIFTPFFTTQKTKTAKGLGLSLVYGFLKQSMSYCLVDTDVNKGSSFSLLFKATVK